MREVLLTDISVGDRIRIEKDGRDYTGILMPSHRFSGDDTITLKLDNGYNIALRVTPEDDVLLLESGDKKEDKNMDLPDIREGLPHISILATGGTIASYVDYNTGAVHPAQTAEEMIYSNPELAERCYPSVKILFSKLSEDIEPENWTTIADKVIEEFRSGAEGVVIAHGTDTLGYTSAALSFLLKDLPGPVVLVGSQRSSDRPSSDASLNLLAAVDVAKEDLSGVYVVMHENLNDDRCSIHLGTKVRKMHTSRRDAFRSVNTEPVGWVDPEEEKVELKDVPRRNNRTPKRTGDINEDVSTLYVYPGVDESRLHAEADGLVLIGTGLGHVPTKLIPSIKKLVDDDIPVVIASQCLYGTVNCNVYSSGRILADTGVISGDDMLPETALVKLMWALTLNEDVRDTMGKNIAGEFAERRW
ncbi:MAG: Glu-tRNA(Gln) amidotransferase subunit GatD [Thermoplasmata archaeon]